MKAFLLIKWDQALSRKGVISREKSQVLLQYMCGQPEGVMGCCLGGHGACHWALGDWERLGGVG